MAVSSDAAEAERRLPASLSGTGCLCPKVGINDHWWPMPPNQRVATFGQGGL